MHLEDEKEGEWGTQSYVAAGANFTNGYRPKAFTAPPNIFS